MNENVKKDIWSHLKKHTNARIALGRTGNSIPTKEQLQFNLSHALAKDAIYKTIEIKYIQNCLLKQNVDSFIINSKAKNKKEYLINPNLGRELNQESNKLLLNIKNCKGKVAIIFADGLSAEAINLNAIPLFFELKKELLKNNFELTPIFIAQHARVALSDAIGEILNCKVALMFIGERPGLSSPHSLGIYLTWEPKMGRTDAERNCISNIHPQGLSYDQAILKTIWLLNAAKKINKSGILLKDESPTIITEERNNCSTLLHSTT